MAGISSEVNTMTFYVKTYTDSAYTRSIETPFDTLDEAREFAIKEFRRGRQYEISVNGQTAILDVGSPKFGIGISKSKYGYAIGFVVRSPSGLWFWVTNQRFPPVKILSPVGKIVKTR